MSKSKKFSNPSLAEVKAVTCLRMTGSAVFALAAVDDEGDPYDKTLKSIQKSCSIAIWNAGLNRLLPVIILRGSTFPKRIMHADHYLLRINTRVLTAIGKGGATKHSVKDICNSPGLFDRAIQLFISEEKNGDRSYRRVSGTKI